MLKINIKNLPKPARIAIAVLPAVLFVVAFSYMGIVPKLERIDSLKQQIVKQQNQIVKNQSMVDRLDELRAENARLKTELANLEEQLPEEEEISSLLKQVSDLGIHAGLKILIWKPAPRRRHPSGIVYEFPVSVQLRGSYHRLGQFFSSLANLDRIVNVGDIKMSGAKPSGKEAVLNVSFSALTFTAISEEDKPAEGKK